MNNILTKNYTAGGAIGPNLLVKWGSADWKVVAAAAAADKLVGVTRANVTVANNDQVDVIVVGEYEIKAGGTIARGDAITSDASGQGVTGSAGNGIIGFAKQAAGIGDLFLCTVQPQVL